MMYRIILHTCFFLLLVSSATAQKKYFKEDFIRTKMNKVADWQLEHPVSFNAKNENDWARAAFYIGLMATYQTTHEQKYLDQAKAWSSSFQYKLANRFRHADDHAKGQVYLEIFELAKDPAMIRDISNTFDSLILFPKAGREDWWWCDALFMAPPVLPRLAKATQNNKYLDFMDLLYWDTYDFLYDKEAKLFYRDASYFNRKTPLGHKVFWARGNGWVVAGLARVLQYLPKDNTSYNRYVKLFQEMCYSIKALQQPDGLWRPSLLDPTEVPHPETSASSFFCYAMAWGVNNEYLDKKEFVPVVKKAWVGLNHWVTPEGKLQWVQPIGASPDKVVQDNFQEYGSGAFLLAGSEVIKLK